MEDVSTTVDNISVKYLYEALAVEIRLREHGLNPITVKLSLIEAGTLTDLLNFVMPYTSHIRVRKSMSP